MKKIINKVIFAEVALIVCYVFIYATFVKDYAIKTFQSVGLVISLCPAISILIIMILSDYYINKILKHINKESFIHFYEHLKNILKIILTIILGIFIINLCFNSEFRDLLNNIIEKLCSSLIDIDDHIKNFLYCFNTIIRAVPLGGITS